MALFEAVMLDFKIHSMFDSIKHFEEVLANNSKNHFVQFYKRDSRTVSSVRKKKIKRYINENLKYYSAKYACIHGGKQFKSRGKTNKRTNTFRKEELCPAFISLNVSKCGNKYIITDINNNHNHKVDKILYSQLPHNRKLSGEARETAKKLLKMKANKHLIRKEIEEIADKHVTLKDLSNIRSEAKSQFTKNSIPDVCKKVGEKFCTDCHLLIEENIFKGLMFCTESMKKSMAAYPELLCIDATYKLLNIRASVYLILIENGSGESDIVAVGILMNEDLESVAWFIDKFKSMNESWTKTRNIMTDKDFCERDVLKNAFPQSQMLICIFHVFRIFQREVTVENMKITASERNLALELLQRLVYSKSEERFNDIKKIIDSTLSSTITNYLNKQWTDIKKEWCPHLGNKILNFMNKTNNRVECINAKLKNVIDKFSTLEEFLDKLFVCLESLEKEKTSRLAYNLNKRPSTAYDKKSPEFMYFEYVTKYAFEKILHQMSDIPKFSCTLDTNDSVYIVTSKKISTYNFDNNDQNNRQNISTSYTCTESSCNCYFFSAMGLPCTHILSVKKFLNKDLFDEVLVNQRWTKNYVLKNSSVFEDHTSLLSDKVSTYDNITTVTTMKSRLPNKMSQQERYKHLFTKCKLIASLASEASGKDFDNLVSIFDELKSFLELNIYNICVKRNNASQNVVERNIGISDIEIESQNVVGSKNNMSESEESGDQMHVFEEENLQELFEDQLPNQHIVKITTLVSSDEEKLLNVMVSSEIKHETVFEHNYAQEYVSNNSEIGNESKVEEEDELINLNSLIVPPALKRKGRPKGSELTAIGTKKRKKIEKKPFAKLPKSERINHLLSWLVKDVRLVYIKKELTEEDLLNIDTIDVRISETNLTIIKKYFSASCWKYIAEIRKEFSLKRKWLCPICRECINNEPSIRCDRCLNWFHVNNCMNFYSSEIQSSMCETCINSHTLSI